MIVGEHDEKALQRGRRQADAKLGQVAFRQREQELPAPDAARFLVGGEAGQREAATPPDAVGGVRSQFVDVEAADLDDFNPAGQRLARPTQERG